jgi:hypothetical protein
MADAVRRIGDRPAGDGDVQDERFDVGDAHACPPGASAHDRPGRGGLLTQSPSEDARGGTVNLPNGGRAKTEHFPLALRGDAQFGGLARPRCTEAYRRAAVFGRF